MCPLSRLLLNLLYLNDWFNDGVDLEYKLENSLKQLKSHISLTRR